MESSDLIDKRVSNENTIDEIAKFLLEERYLLTALELYTELVESGAELTRLRDYFSNPANFDLLSKSTGDAHSSTVLNRSSSQTTIDSLDWARYSEDGERIIDDRVAVLEFELRKAKETIQGLRANLTQATAAEDGESAEELMNKTPHDFNVKELRPHQVRTLNFLINEYLSAFGYKMTAITFADENDNQDFENWDDVGLNIPRPLSLAQWIFEKGQSLVSTSCSSCQTEEDHTKTYESQIAELEERIKNLQVHNERQEEELQKLRRRTSTPEITPSGTPPNDLSDEVGSLRISQQKFNSEVIISSAGDEMSDKVTDASGNDVSPLVGNADICDNENVALNIDQFEKMNQFSNVVESLEDMLEGASGNQFTDSQEPKDICVYSQDTPNLTTQYAAGAETPSSETAESEAKTMIVDDLELRDMIDPKKCDRLPPLGACSEWNPQGILAGEFIVAQQEEVRRLLNSSSRRKVPPYLENQLLNICVGSTLDADSRLQSEVASLSMGHCDLLNLVSMSLHNIVPNVILSKREELLPLLVYCISQHPEGSEREKLLNLLFNLTKKPDKEQRSTILLGLLSLARIMPPDKLEAELLPQCWEQLTHKYTERRILVAQSVAVLAPYTPTPLRNSLLISMLQQILSSEGEKDPSVISAASASMALLIAYLDDFDKIGSLISAILFSLEAFDGSFDPIVSSSPPEASCSIVLLLLSVTHWALDHSHLKEFVESTLARLKSHLLACQKSRNEGKQSSYSEQLTRNVVTLVKALHLICPYLVIYLFNSLKDCDDSYKNESQITSVSACGVIQELSIILESRDKAEECMNKVQYYISKDQIHKWPELEFITNSFILIIIQCISLVEADMKEEIITFIDLIWRMNTCFGTHVKQKYICQFFLNQLSVDERALEKIKSGSTPLTKAPLIVYALGVLGDDDNKGTSEALTEFLSRQINILALCGAPNTALQMTILLLLEKTKSVEAILGALWACIVHRSALVRGSSAPLWGLLIGNIKEAELSSRVIPALVTLATDQEVSVRASSLAPLTSIIANVPSKDVCDKVWLQLESICDELNVLESPILQIAIAQTCSFFGHSTPSNLLHTIYLPCLCRAALEGKGTPQDKIKFGVSLLEAFTAISSSTIPNHLVAHFILPPLNQLQKTLGAMSYEHMETINLLTKEYALKAQAPTLSERSHSNSTTSLSSLGQSISSSVGAMGAGLPPIGSGVEDVKNKMSKMFSSGMTSMGSGLHAPSIKFQTVFKKK